MFTSPARRRRRRSIWTAIGVGVALAVAVGLLLFVGPLNDERIRRYTVDVAVQDDGSALVHEVIDYDFGANARHGITREIPENRSVGSSSEVSDITVQSSSAPADVLVTRERNQVVIRIGDPNKTVRGKHRYEITYRLTGVVVEERVRFNAIGTEWRVPIDSAYVTIFAPYTLESPRCYQGKQGSLKQCDELAVDSFETDSELTAIAGRLDKSEGMTIGAGVGKTIGDGGASLPGYIRFDTGTNPYWWLRAMALILGAGVVGYVIGYIPVAIWARRVGRDTAWHGGGGAVDAVFGGPGLPTRPVDDVIADQQTTIQFVPPRNLTPAQGGVLLHEDVTDDHRVAWLTEYAWAGWFRIENDGKTLTWTAPDDQWAAAPAPLHRIFTGRRHVSLNEYDRQFATGWALIDNELETWQKTSGLWDLVTEKRSSKTAAIFLGIGVLAAALGGFMLWITASSLPWVAVTAGGFAAVFVGAGVSAAVNWGELAVRTPEGFAKRQLVEGFRRFFEVSEGRHAQEAAERGELRLYSAWAVALGELTHWNAAMASAAIPPSTPGYSDVGRIAALSAAVHVASTAPSSSGSGGSGGGGGVGGGAGGGGGGSW